MIVLKPRLKKKRETAHRVVCEIAAKRETTFVMIDSHQLLY